MNNLRLKEQRLALRNIPEGYTAYKKTPQGVVYVSTEDSLSAKAYKGTSQKAAWWIKFNSIERRDEKINNFFKSLESWEKLKQERKEERKKEVEDLQVGDLLHYSWGYEQTNCEFYQVVAKKGKKFTIHEISSKHIRDNSDMSDFRSPIKGAFLIDEPNIEKTSLSMKFGWLNKTHEAREHFCSWYA